MPSANLLTAERRAPTVRLERHLRAVVGGGDHDGVVGMRISSSFFRQEQRSIDRPKPNIGTLHAA